MEIAAAIAAHWSEQHTLGRPELAWLHDHADPGDTHPITTALDLLRAPTPAADAPPVGVLTR